MTPTTFTLVDGTKVVVPDAPDLITPYVLREQQDWFEDEIRFLRAAIEPGMRVIDIGANYGVYTLTMARAVGAEGHVWAFEPASRTASFLALGVQANGYPNVTIDRSAVSDHSGSAELTLHANAELNALSGHGGPTGQSETVPLVTLDDRMDAYAWRDIALLKIDAEGEEANIVRGGRRFFATVSPLVMYEIKAGNDLHLELVETFEGMGLHAYRLVPGLGVLVPFDRSEGADGFLLNLFGCKPDRAEQLARRGLLVESAAALRMPPPSGAPELGPYHWRHALAHRPHGVELRPLWEQHAGGLSDSGPLEAALALHARSSDGNLPAAERVAALSASLQILQSLCHGNPAALRLSSMARVAGEFGARSLAAHALQHLANQIVETRSIDPTEPFLAPHVRFDGISPRGRIGEWVLGSVLEAQELACHFSSFYTGPSALRRLEIIDSLGFGSAEMARRLSLVRGRLAPVKVN